MLKSAAALPLAALALCGSAAGQPAPVPAEISPAQSFNFAWLKAYARQCAARPYQPPPASLPPPIANLNWDQMQAIRFKPELSLWQNAALPFRLRFFHLGLYNKVPVEMFEVVNGLSRRIDYNPAMFEYGNSGVDGKLLPKDLGFAGFQLLVSPDWTRDVAAFQGASYFRAVTGALQYGMSVRGLAIDCGISAPEEFPIFTHYWFEKPAAGVRELTIYALLDSPSVAGAYRWRIKPGETQVMDIDAELYPRRSIERVGIAPLTSMFLCGENDRRMSADFRPEIHDSDGLSMWTGAGEWIWRPLVDPTTVRNNSFVDDNPRGFGLLQRDQNFDHYQDDGAFYDRRPSVWIEPLSGPRGAGWGKGAVQLVEIPTLDETFDNIVAFWHPEAPLKAGQGYHYAYRLYWCQKFPLAEHLATVRATRTGIGGVVGQTRTYYSRRFVVDFAGKTFEKLARGAKVEPIITASRGEIEITSARPLDAIHGWRAIFDLKPTDDSVEPINLRLYLRADGHALTETWLYQWTPPAPVDRKF
jgi:glucans biosynthesis protein